MDISKPKDPREKPTTKYNPLSRFFFSWLDPLLWYGSRHTLEHEDLYCHPAEGDSRYLLEKFNGYWNKLTVEEKRKPTSLLFTLIKCVFWRLIVHAFLFGSVIAMYVSFAMLLGTVTDYFIIESPTDTDTANAYYSAIGMIILATFTVMFVHLYSTIGLKMEMFLKITCSTAIYQKILTLTQTTVNQVSVGHIVNLISNDVHRFDQVFFTAEVLWVAPLLIVCVTCILYFELGVVIFIAVGMVLGQMLFQVFLCRGFGKMRLKAAKMTDKRLKVMNEVISGMRVIKMYGWENAFHDLVSGIRRKEISIIMRSCIFLIISSSFISTMLPSVMFVTFSVFAAKEGIEAVTPRRVFISLTLLAILTLNCNLLFIFATIHISEALIAVKRIKEFLMLEILPELAFAVEVPPTTSPVHGCHTPCVSVSGLCCSWTNDLDRLSLKDVSFRVDKDSKLMAVIGPVGSGKSTLLQCILHELPLISGDIHSEGTIAYAGQEQWIFSDTLRENILFGESYDSEWYSTVVNACALNKDIDMLPNGDMTLVGERGVTLSGGQKARVSLARAVYRKAGIYLLDDPLSAVDAVVSRHIFEVCIKGLLLSSGSSVVILVTHQTQFVKHCDTVLKLCEGKVDYCQEPKYVSNDISDSGSENSFDISVKCDIDGTNTMFQPEDKHVGSISYKTYYKYFKAGGGSLLIITTVAIFFLAEVLTVVSNWWLASWSTISVNGTEPTNFSLSAQIGVYGGLVGSVWILAVLKNILLYHILLRATLNLHNNMFIAVLRSPILFFDTNPVGRVLNRFSKDTGSMDSELIENFLHFFLIFVQFLCIITTAAIANYYLAAVVLFMLVLFFGLRWYFLQSARQIKRLESLARSPLYSHVSMTLQGLPTIRAYNKQSDMVDKFHEYQNRHTQAWYLFIMVSRWLGIRVDVILTIFLSMFTLLSIPLTKSLDPSLVGLTLTYILSLLDAFQYCVRLSADIESQMVSTERVIAYGQLPSEGELRVNDKPALTNWPDKGKIEIADLKYRHSANSPDVLNGISCVIESKDKVGIVGRTGAGKSSLVASLFRLAEPSGGSILIDGVDCCSVGLHDLRPSISIIPQDPVLFSGTLRHNLDPFNHYNDNDIWNALRQVQLENFCMSSFDGGLERLVNEGGSNFSVGQRQLICLARAMLRHNQILVMDEATANVDNETDAIIQQVVREQFSDCTVLTIAHRLDTVMDSDKIMVLSQGELVEYGRPHKLLSSPDSVLSKLVDSTGPSNAEKLRTIADTH